MRLTESQIEEIKDTLHEVVIDDKVRLPAKELLSKLGWKEDNTKFKSALSYAFKKELFPGFETVRGRYGGIKKAEPGKVKDTAKIIDKGKKVAATEVPVAAKLVETTSKVNDNIVSIPNRKNQNRLEWNDIIVGGKTFSHTMNLHQIRNFMKYVIKAKEVEKGNVEAFNAQYQLDEKELEMLDNLIFYCFGAKQRISK